MNKIYLFFLPILIYANGFSQQKSIELKQEKFIIPHQDFYIANVTDNREKKDDIGFVYKGLFNKKTRAYFKGGLEYQFSKYLSNNQTDRILNEPIVLKVVEFNISEKTNSVYEFGYVNIKAEFYRIEDDNLKKVFEIETSETGSAMDNENGFDVTKGHEQRIRKVLIKCLEEFSKSNWKNIN